MADRYVNYDELLKERHRLGLDEMSMINKVNAFNQFIDSLPIANVVPKSKLAKEIFEEADEIFMSNCKSLEDYQTWNELKRKYMEVE